MDCFSSNSNAKCSKFFSKIPQVGTAGIDVFAQTLTCSEIYWCCPPPRLIIQTIKHILSFVNITSIVILPLWKSSNFWPFIKRNDYFARFVSKYYIFQPLSDDIERQNVSIPMYYRTIGTIDSFVTQLRLKDYINFK